ERTLAVDDVDGPLVGSLASERSRPIRESDQQIANAVAVEIACGSDDRRSEVGRASRDAVDGEGLLAERLRKIERRDRAQVAAVDDVRSAASDREIVVTIAIDVPKPGDRRAKAVSRSAEDSVSLARHRREVKR